MASKEKIVAIIASIKVVYPYYAKDGNAKLTASIWERLLQPYNDEETSAAFYHCLQTCKTPPTPADVIEKINEARKALDPSEESLWIAYRDALEKTLRLWGEFGYTFVDRDGISQGQKARNKVAELYENLPEIVKCYLGDQSELLRVAKTLNSQDANYEKARFLKALQNLEKRQRVQEVLGTSTHLLEGGG